MNWHKTKDLLPGLEQRVLIATTLQGRAQVTEGFMARSGAGLGWFTINGAGPLAVTHWAPMPLHPALTEDFVPFTLQLSKCETLGVVRDERDWPFTDGRSTCELIPPTTVRVKE